MKPGDLVEIDYITADIFKIPCAHGGFVTGVVIESVFIHPIDKSLNCWSVFMDGQIVEFNEREIELVNCEMVLTSDHLQLVNDATAGYNNEKET